MIAAHPLPLSAELAHRVESFEAALAADPDADPGAFLPPPSHPLHAPVLGELVRAHRTTPAEVEAVLAEIIAQGPLTGSRNDTLPEMSIPTM